MGLRSPEAAAASGRGLLASVYIPDLQQTEARDPGQITPARPQFSFLHNRVWAASTIVVHKDGWVWDDC